MERNIDERRGGLPKLAGKKEVEIYSEVESSDDFRDPKEGRGTDRNRHRKKHRDRDSDRRRHPKRKRHRESRSHRRSTDSSRSRSRSNSWYRARRRSYSYHSNGSRDSRDSQHSDNTYYHSGRDRGADSYKYQDPNSTIMVRGLAAHLGENEIRQDILKCGILVKDIRLIRHRETGVSRGFAFVEFNTTQEATRWMESKKGIITFADQSQASMIYSLPKLSNPDRTNRLSLADWYCAKCQGHNFKRRDFCYKCHASRPEEFELGEADDTSFHPTSTIALGNLDALTIEDAVLQAFQQRQFLASVPIRSVRIARDSSTNLSLGICYVELNNVSDAVQFHNTLTRDHLTIDGRQVTVAYIKPNAHMPAQANISSVAATALAAAQWSVHGCKNQPTTTDNFDEDEVEKMAEYSATLYAKTAEEYASYLTYYRDYYQKQQNGSQGNTNASGTNNWTSSAETKKEESATGSDVSTRAREIQIPVVDSGFPLGSQYQYDEASGYYYDSGSGYYYDPTTKYFYDASKQQFLYWSTDQKTLVPVPTSNPPLETSKKEPKLKIEKCKPDRVKVAKKIAKDMEKWAKTLNQKKDFPKYYAFNESTYSMQDDIPQDALSVVGNGSPSPASVSDNYFTNIHTYADESDSDGEVNKTDTGFGVGVVDFPNLSCLICKRRFPDRAILIKHIDLSEMHKANLELLARSNENEGLMSENSSSSSYRDRAKERRSQFGSVELI